MNSDPVWRSAWVARLNWPSPAPRSRPPTIARTAPSGDITTIAAWALEPALSLVSKTAASPSSAALWICGSKVVMTCTSSVVLRVRNSGPDDITQSAKAPPARAAAAVDSCAGRACASRACWGVR